MIVGSPIQPGFACVRDFRFTNENSCCSHKPQISLVKRKSLTQAKPGWMGLPTIISLTLSPGHFGARIFLQAGAFWAFLDTGGLRKCDERCLSCLCWY